MTKVLWIAPNLNHYKIRFLSKLAQRGGLELTVIAGRSPVELGHAPVDNTPCFQRIDVSADRNDFALRKEGYAALTDAVRSRRFHTVLMPAERKYLPLILYLRLLRSRYGFRLVSYNHPMTAESGRAGGFPMRSLVRFMFSLYDRVIFYTEGGRGRAVAQQLLRKEAAFFANNTLDTEDIWQHSQFEINDSEQLSLLFIGRLVHYRWLDVLFHYFDELKRLCPAIRLVIIGDGPESKVVEGRAADDCSIQWRGGIFDERLIAEEMKLAHLVFIPGASGLSIVHAFCYGKPYATLASYPKHGPEIDYLEDDVNGLLLSGDCTSDCIRIINLLRGRERYRSMCTAAFTTAGQLSVQSWCERMERALAADR